MDLRSFVSALENRRVSEGLSWRQVAQHSGVSPSTLSRLQKGKQPDVNSFAALVRWLEVPAERFLGLPGPPSHGAPASPLAALLGGQLATPKEAAALADLVQAAHRLIRMVDQRQEACLTDG